MSPSYAQTGPAPQPFLRTAGEGHSRARVALYALLFWSVRSTVWLSLTGLSFFVETPNDGIFYLSDRGSLPLFPIPFLPDYARLDQFIAALPVVLAAESFRQLSRRGYVYSWEYRRALLAPYADGSLWLWGLVATRLGAGLAPIVSPDPGEQRFLSVLGLVLTVAVVAVVLDLVYQIFQAPPEEDQPQEECFGGRPIR